MKWKRRGSDCYQMTAMRVSLLTQPEFFPSKVLCRRKDMASENVGSSKRSSVVYRYYANVARFTAALMLTRTNFNSEEKVSANMCHDRELTDIRKGIAACWKKKLILLPRTHVSARTIRLLLPMNKIRRDSPVLIRRELQRVMDFTLNLSIWKLVNCSICFCLVFVVFYSL